MPDINMQHMIAVMLLDGNVTLQVVARLQAHARPESREAQESHELAGDLDVSSAQRWSAAGMPRSRSRCATAACEHYTQAARGSSVNPMTREEEDEKALDLLAPVLGKKRAQTLIAAVWQRRKYQGCAHVGDALSRSLNLRSSASAPRLASRRCTASSSSGRSCPRRGPRARARRVDELVVAQVDADVRERAAHRVEEYEVARLQLGFFHRLAGAADIARGARQVEAQALAKQVAHEAGAVEAGFGVVAAAAIADADEIERVGDQLLDAARFDRRLRLRLGADRPGSPRLCACGSRRRDSARPQPTAAKNPPLRIARHYSPVLRRV